MVNIQNLPPPMTKEEETELCKNWTSDSWKTLAERSIKLALSVAKSFTNTGIDEDDLFGIASIGLVKAAKKFNHEAGTKFSSYAIPTMRNEILYAIRKDKKCVQPSASLDERINISIEDTCELKEMIADDFDTEDFAMSKCMENIMRNKILSSNEMRKNVISLFVLGVKQKENAYINGITQSYVSKIVRQFKKELMEEWKE